MASGRQIAACLILVLVALSIAACGKDSPQGPKIPPETAAILTSKLDVVQERMTPEKECGTEDSAQTSLNSVQGFVDQIPEDEVDPQILSDLSELLDGFDQKLAADCDAGGLAAAESTSTETTTTSTTTDLSSTTDKSTTDKPTTDTTEPTTTEPTTSTTTQPTTTTQPESPSPPAHSNAGGNGNGNGATQGGFEAGGTSPGGRIPANGGGR